MQTEAVFENISNRIHLELSKASRSIIVAVAWLTNASLFFVLLEKAKNGVNVELMLMNDEINNSCGIDYNKLSQVGGKLWLVGSEGSRDRLMHNKFCVIDNETVINGSYNWTNKAKLNHESITIVADNNEFAEKFLTEFHTIKEFYFGADNEVQEIDLEMICSRLKTLEEAIRINDIEDINYIIQKIKKCLPPIIDPNLDTLHLIITFIEKKRFTDALNLIASFRARYVSLILYSDLEVAALTLEMKSLEIQISSLEDEKVELEKLLYEFEIRHNSELGEIILKILKLRTIKYQNETNLNPERQRKYQEAKQDYNQYNNYFNDSIGKIIIKIPDDQRDELKRLYRNASKLCHPDAVAEKYKKGAENIFKELNNAYKANDIEKVRILLRDLEKGIFISGSDTLSEKLELIKKVNYLRLLRDDLERKILNIKNSNTFQKISNIENWDLYFSGLKNQLDNELTILVNEL